MALTLLCARPLPPHPTPVFQPKIIWLKNKMDLQGNPKYRALSHLGICSLEIRKPSPFDGGIYTCKAVNALGEASVDCRVEVKGKDGGIKYQSSPSTLQEWLTQAEMGKVLPLYQLLLE